MTYNVGEAKNNLPKLLKLAEQGEEVIIARHGKAIAKLTATEKPKHKRRFGTMKDVWKLEPGWDADIPMSDWDVFREPTDGSAPIKVDE